jgi:GAF domain-containing protein
VAAAGFEADGERPKATWADTPRGRGVIGQAIRTGRPAVMRHIPTDPAHKPWRGEAGRLGYGAACSLPLPVDDSPPLTLTLHAAAPDAFDEQEVALLAQLLDHVTTTLRERRQPPGQGRTKESTP